MNDSYFSDFFCGMRRPLIPIPNYRWRWRQSAMDNFGGIFIKGLIVPIKL